MTASQVPTYLQLGLESRIRLPDVDEVLDKGHAIYTVDNPHLGGTADHEVAKRQVADFLALKPIPNTTEEPYLSAMFGVARGYARDLSRANKEWQKELEAAQVELDKRNKQSLDGALSKHGISVMWRFVGPIILGLTGFLFAQFVGSTVPEGVSETTGTSIPTVGMIFLFLWLGRIASLLLFRRRLNQIALSYEAREYLANQTYEDKKRNAFIFWRQRGGEEWEQYTGTEYPERVSYLTVMKGDAIAKDRMREHVVLSAKSDLGRLFEGARTITSNASRRLFRRRKAETAAQAE